MSTPARYSTVRPLSQGWMNRLTFEQKERVERAVKRALFMQPSMAVATARTGISRGVIEKLRTGNTPPTATHLEKLAPLLNTTPEAILSGEWRPT